MIIYKTESEIALMKEAAMLVSKTLTEVAKVLKPGMTTLQIDKLCADFIKQHNAISSFLNYRGYPFTICASVNDVVVHGFPNDIPLQNGDIVSIDMGVILNGWHGDHAYTFILGEADPAAIQLVKITKESLYKGIEKAIVNNRIGDIAFAIQEHTEIKNGYGVVRELVGHGLGRSLHEDPQMPNYGKRGSGPKLKENLVLAIEPMINLGSREVYTDEDGWTVRTRDGKPSVHFEHDVCVKRNKALILSDYSIIEAAEKANPNLNTSYYS
ncbi:MAG: type I methionyl aminopeptidase [Sphingobacteriia bacterium RIFOXYD2_FULL_35_12]|jgi:methionyl aminopeptidase|nr:MAG: type I methionyl aminopeptidase [Sphingobacteriia bacterium RIFOXYC2_FULL_35_18]OHC88970.1 MAG: type I methionyl aminopeptidase [Sphingobacteriia bacterium RIFOXYD2_FULL_35_12]OYY11296.1 MAG: type I methionyl aminopeptidase [Sphingobacteriia bacterium 35-36-14]OYZ53678.1 MAG: type I methionyl aminopeptidase [Sphingobacteriia bacterium 24-36-13]OZA64146.1 MAG: type I methionyl aminopeptidase [Sphingobacteriia bacterium 39-36-14]